ncbi:MAG TPA: AAA family ATPase [Pseudonocardiaceae bacterium]|jgi:uridine kinase|nr:AAA family ATPase [Pseudonocardiaceae bacterium]
MPNMQAVLQEIFRRPSVAGMRLVGVDGPAGSGKTVFARALAELARAPVIELDDFVSWSDFTGWRPRFQREVLEPLLSGRDACYRVRDWANDEFGTSLKKERKIVRWAPLLVLEGVSCTCRAVDEILAYRVWIEAPRRQRLRRGLARDGEDHRDFWLRWQDEEDRFFAADDTRSRADLVVDTADADGTTG